MTTCSVPYCKSTKRKTPGVSFHEFPSKEPRRSQWIEIIQSCEGAGNIWQPSDHSVICGLHFKPEDFKSNCKHFLLLPESVPNVFKENSKHSNIKTRKRRRVLTRNTSLTVTKFKTQKKTCKEEKENDKKSTKDNENVTQFTQQIQIPDPESVPDGSENTSNLTQSVGCQTEILSVKILRKYQDELRQARNSATCLIKRLEMLENEIKILIDEKSNGKM